VTDGRRPVSVHQSKLEGESLQGLRQKVEPAALAGHPVDEERAIDPRNTTRGRGPQSQLGILGTKHRFVKGIPSEPFAAAHALRVQKHALPQNRDGAGRSGVPCLHGPYPRL
jgi:hypothetical protein